MAFRQAKEAKYSSKECEVDEIEHLADKLAADLRKQIKLLGSHPILSKEWLDMSETFGRIASISDMESKLAGVKNEDKTLWDTEEQALRFLIEDGKLNLCLRNMIEYKNQQRLSRNMAYNGAMASLREECDKFEKGLGVVLRNAWNHVEAIQTTDILALMTHVCDVLESALRHPEVMEGYCKGEDLHQRQETLVFWYLNSVMLHAESVHEERVMSLLRERGAFMMSVQWLSLYSDSLTSSHVAKATEALALMVDTDDFKTYRDSYFCSSSDVALLLTFKTKCIERCMAEFTQKRIIRPLVDAIERARRKHKM